MASSYDVTINTHELSIIDQFGKSIIDLKITDNFQKITIRFFLFLFLLHCLCCYTDAEEKTNGSGKKRVEEKKVKKE